MPIYISKYSKTNQIDSHKLSYSIVDLKPLFKWTLSNDISYMLDIIFQKLPNTFNGNYYENYIGNGVILFKLLQQLENNQIKIHPDFKIYVNDTNKSLINFYNMVQVNHKKLSKEINKLINKYNELEPKDSKRKINLLQIETKNIDDVKTQEEYYYVLRKEYNLLKQTELNNIRYGALFLFFCKATRSENYKENNNGSFIGEFGNNKIYSDKSHIKSLNYYLTKYNIKFLSEDVKTFNMRPSEHDYVIFNPPFFPATLNFKKYKGYQKFIYNDSNKHIGIGEKTEYYIKNIDTNDYIPVDTKSKSAYKNLIQSGHGVNDNILVADICKDLKMKHIDFLLINSCCNWNMELYNDFTIEKVLKKNKSSIDMVDLDCNILVI